MSANETRIKILCAVQQLERFTIADLCLHTGLEPSQVYREIADLQKREILTSAAVMRAGEAAPAHRAPKLYRLASEPEKRATLQEEVERFLPTGLNPAAPSAHLERAQGALSLITEELLEASLSRFSGTQLDQWESELGSRLEEAGQALKRATWESELDFSEESNSRHPLAVAVRLHRTLSDRFQELARAERDRRERAAAESDWSRALPQFARAAMKMVVPATAALGVSIGLNPAVSAVVAAVTVKFLEKQMEQGALKGSLYEQTLNWLGASLKRDLSSADSKAGVLAALAKHFITYSDNPEAALKYLRQLHRQKSDYRLDFDQANLELLQHKIEGAQEYWTAYRNHRQALAAPPPLVVGRMTAKNWSDPAYRDTIQEISKRYPAAISALSQSAFGAQEDKILRPRLFNPLYGKNDREPEYVPLSENASSDLILHVTRPSGETLVTAGVPKLVWADLFCESGRALEEAWGAAMRVKPDDRILRIEFIESPNSTVRQETERILEDHFRDAVAFA